MPEISLFTESELPCIMMTIILHIFHAEYNGNKAIIEIDAARVIKGALPSRQPN